MSDQTRNREKQAAGEDQPDYSDIINLPHHVSARHPQMSRTARAAQFGSFEPLRDYRDVLAEERRLTDERPVLSEEEQKKLNEMVAKLASDTAQPSVTRPKIRMTVFVQDEKKEGGRIEKRVVTAAGILPQKRILLTEGEDRIPISDILDMEPAPEDG